MPSPPRSGPILAAWLLIALAGPGCQSSGPRAGPVEVPVVAWFDGYREVLEGSAYRYDFIQARSMELSSRVSGMRCIGEARPRIVPPEAVMGENCAGVQGDAELTCSDGRQLALGLILDESCEAGYGRGNDQAGYAVHMLFGGSRQQIDQLARDALADLASYPPLPSLESGELAAPSGITTGTGFFVSWEGHLLTNHHVVRAARSIRVKLGDGELLEAELVDADAENDLALLRVPAIRTPLPVQAPHGLVKGAEVFTLGYPLIQLQGQEQKATFGRVNALSGLEGDQRFTQIDVPIQPGNSGGPLLDDRGQVVGVVTSMLHPMAAIQAGGVTPQNVNYALKSDLVAPLLERDLGPLTRPEGSALERRGLPALIAEAENSVVLVVADR